MKKVDTISQEWIEILARIEKENRFWQSLSEIGFIRANAMVDMESIKHYSLPIHTSFIMNKKTCNILAMTIELGSWVYPDEAYYVGEDGNHYVRHPLTIPIMSCENFIKWHIHRVRKLTNEVLLKLDNRSI